MSDRVSQVRTFEVLTATAVSPRRPPRHWSDDEKARLVAEAFSPGSTVAEVARAYELDVSQLYAWRRKALSSGAVAPLAVPLGGRGGSPNDPLKFTRFDAGAGAPVEIVLGDAVVRVGGDIDPDQLTAKVRHSTFDCAPGCSVEAAISLIDGKWKCVLLFHLLDGTRRFNELKRHVPNVTQRTLTNQLRELEADGLITREVYPVVPPKVEYTISDLGRSLSPILKALKQWGDANMQLFSNPAA